MGSILKPYTNFVSPGKLQVPVGKLAVDWSHPLARGLVCCCVPGVMMGNDISLSAIFLAPESASAFNMNVEGSCLLSTAASSGIFALATNILKSWNEFTLYWRGVQTGVPSTNRVYIGVTYDNAGTSPFAVATVQTNGTANLIIATWNTNGTPANSQPVIAGWTIPTTGALVGLGATFKVGGSVVGYTNGLLIGSVGFGANPPTSTATSIVAVNDYNGGGGNTPNASCNIAAFWNRQLTADEMAWLHREPYSFLISAEYEMPMMNFVTPSTKIFSFSQMSTHVTQKLVNIAY